MEGLSGTLSCNPAQNSTVRTGMRGLGFPEIVKDKVSCMYLIAGYVLFSRDRLIKKNQALIRTGDLFLHIKDKLSNIFILTSDVLVHVTTFAL